MEALANPDCGWFYRADASGFEAIPGSPIAYWASEVVLKTFKTSLRIGSMAFAGKGVVTGNDARFLRLWYEIAKDNFSEFASFGLSKWKPCNKGGQFRRWFGNNDYVINWGNDGVELKEHCWPDGRQRSSMRNSQYMFKSAITWTYITSGKPCFRYYPEGYAFVGVGPGVFPNNNDELLLLLAFLNSSVFFYLSSICGGSTISLESGEVERAPYKSPAAHDLRIKAIAHENVVLSENDWDSFEISWNFCKHPLI